MLHIQIDSDDEPPVVVGPVSVVHGHEYSLFMANPVVADSQDASVSSTDANMGSEPSSIDERAQSVFDGIFPFAGKPQPFTPDSAESPRAAEILDASAVDDHQQGALKTPEEGKDTFPDTQQWDFPDTQP